MSVLLFGLFPIVLLVAALFTGYFYMHTGNQLDPRVAIVGAYYLTLQKIIGP